MKLSREQVLTFMNYEGKECLSKRARYYMAYYDHVYSKGGFFTWNWAAAIFGWAWGVYRGAYVALLYTLLVSFLGEFSSDSLSFYSKIWILNIALFGLCGIGFYFRWMEWKIGQGVTACRTRILPIIGFGILFGLIGGSHMRWKTTTTITKPDGSVTKSEYYFGTDKSSEDK